MKEQTKEFRADLALKVARITAQDTRGYDVNSSVIYEEPAEENERTNSHVRIFARELLTRRTVDLSRTVQLLKASLYDLVSRK